MVLTVCVPLLHTSVTFRAQTRMLKTMSTPTIRHDFILPEKNLSKILFWHKPIICVLLNIIFWLSSIDKVLQGEMLTCGQMQRMLQYFKLEIVTNERGSKQLLLIIIIASNKISYIVCVTLQTQKWTQTEGFSIACAGCGQGSGWEDSNEEADSTSEQSVVSCCMIKTALEITHKIKVARGPDNYLCSWWNNLEKNGGEAWWWND